MDKTTLPWEKVKDQSIEEVLNLIIAHPQVITIHCPNGEAIIMQPKQRLKPLSVLDGAVPEGWKEAIYNDSK